MEGDGVVCHNLQEVRIRVEILLEDGKLERGREEEDREKEEEEVFVEKRERSTAPGSSFAARAKRCVRCGDFFYHSRDFLSLCGWILLTGD